MKLFHGSIASFAVLIASLSLCAAEARAEESESYAGEVTASQLRLRSGPGEAYQDVVMLPRGSLVVVVGRHANNPDWLQVEVPGGYHAWVSGKYAERKDDGTVTITGDRVQIRPRPSTKYHQLGGIFMKGDSTRVIAEKQTDDGLWYQVLVPASVPLYAHSGYVKNVGPATLALEGEKKAAAAPEEPTGDRMVREMEPQVREAIAKGGEAEEIERLRRALSEIDRGALSDEMREKRFVLVTDLMDAEKELAVRQLKAKESQLRGDLDRRLQEIERDYRRRLQEIRDEFEKEEKPRYVAVGVVMFRPDVLGRIPSYRLEEAGQMRYFLIATAYDLSRFANKRVGVTGLVDPESGTGYETIMVKRIEIVGEE